MRYKSGRVPQSDAERADVGKLEARDVTGYMAQPQTADEIDPWLDEQVWSEARFSKADGEEPR